jgi:hypothetical protein
MDKQKQKQKREHSRRLDALVVGCAIGSGCDEAEWVQLAVNYAHEFRCPYALSSVHMRSLETSAERDAAKQMEARVNKVITKTIQRERPMGAMGRMAMERLSSQPTPNLRTILRPCKCTGPHQSPNCKMHSALCKTAVHTLSRAVPRKPKTPSPKTKKSPPKHDKHGGKNKSKSSKRR